MICFQNDQVFIPLSHFSDFGGGGWGGNVNSLTPVVAKLFLCCSNVIPVFLEDIFHNDLYEA